MSADAYDRFMGRYSLPLAPQLADMARVVRGQRVLDVGCGPGALTRELVGRVGADLVAAVDPSESFVVAAGERCPGVQVELAAADRLPFEDHVFDATLAQLVVHFMEDPVAGLREMARVTRPGGVVAVSVWDHAGRHGPLNLFWEAARARDPDLEGEAHLPGAREGHLMELLDAAGLQDIEGHPLRVEVEHPSFEEWWEPFTQGVGPAGAHVASLDVQEQGRLRDRCRELLPEAPFVITAVAWAATGIAPSG